MRGINHGLRIFAIWLVASIIAEVLIAIIPWPIPSFSDQAEGVHGTMYVLFYIGAPIFVFVWVLLLYNLVVFRAERGPAFQDVPARPDSGPILWIWAFLSFTIVLFLAGWGTFTLHDITQANGAKLLPIQVIGQQWQWTYRYPTYGGMETKDLFVPVNTPIRFDLTSLDVVHSFWMYEYDIKEDAVPGVSNTAYFLAKRTAVTTNNGRYAVRCNELCGLWHGHMHTRLAVLSRPAFASWAAKQLASEKSSGLLKVLPPYAPVYYPASNANWPSPPQDQSP